MSSDLDSLLEDLQVEVNQSVTKPEIALEESQPAVAIPEQEADTPADRLARYAEKNETFILVPIKDKNGTRTGFIARELKDATSEEFLSWARYVLPLDSLKDEDPRAYDELKIKEATFAAILRYRNDLVIPCKRGLEDSY